MRIGIIPAELLEVWPKTAVLWDRPAKAGSAFIPRRQLQFFLGMGIQIVERYMGLTAIAIITQVASFSVAARLG